MPAPVNKATLRRLMRDRRAQCDPALGTVLARQLFASGLIQAGSVIAGYWPIGSEIDVRPVLAAACRRGHVVGLPVTPATGEPLSFRRWEAGMTMRPGRFGIPEPVGALVRPEVVLVPLLAFDRSGGRLGYGGGFYDRSFAAMAPVPLTIGCGFVAQEVDTVPTGPHDWPMDLIATEAGVIVVE